MQKRFYKRALGAPAWVSGVLGVVMAGMSFWDWWRERSARNGYQDYFAHKAAFAEYARREAERLRKERERAEAEHGEPLETEWRREDLP